jgi:hypothetical protein
VTKTIGPFRGAIWLHRARQIPKEQCKQGFKRKWTGRETEPWEIIHCKLYQSQTPIIERAIETAALMLGSDQPRTPAPTAGSCVLRESAAAGATSRWLAVSILRDDVEPGSPPPTVSQLRWQVNFTFLPSSSVLIHSSSGIFQSLQARSGYVASISCSVPEIADGE